MGELISKTRNAEEFRDEIMLPMAEQQLINNGYTDEAERTEILKLMPTSTDDAVIDGVGWLNSLILSMSKAVPVSGVVLMTGTKVAASISLDFAHFKKGQPRDDAAEIVAAEAIGGFVSIAISLATTAGSIAAPEFTPAIKVGGSTLAVFASNYAIAKFHEGYDYIFGHNYYAEYDSNRVSLTLNVDNLEDGFNDYWVDKQITAVDPTDENKVKYRLTLSEVNEWKVRLWDYSKNVLPDQMLSLHYTNTDNTLKVNNASSKGNSTDFTEFYRNKKEVTSFLLERFDDRFNLDFEGDTKEISNYFNHSVSQLENEAKSGEAKALAALEYITPFHEEGKDHTPITAEWSENFIRDRAKFVYAEAHGDEDHIRFEDKKLKIVVEPGGSSITYKSNYVFGTSGSDSFGWSMMDYRGRDHLYGMGGNDRLNGYGDNDELEGGKGQDTMHGGEGNDTFFIYGTDTDYDIFNGGDGEDTIKGGDHASNLDDTIRVRNFTGDNTVEIIDGGKGENTLAGTDQSDTIDLSDTQLKKIKEIQLQGGNDTLILDGEKWDSTLTKIDGGQGDDTIEGKSGGLFGDPDTTIDLRNLEFTSIENIKTYGGDDQIRLDGVTLDTDLKTIDAGDGENTINLDNAQINSTLTITGGKDKDTFILSGATINDALTITGGDGENEYDLANVNGSADSITITGGAADETMDGSNAEMKLILNGGTGDDTLEGGEGEDDLHGGAQWLAYASPVNASPPPRG